VLTLAGVLPTPPLILMAKGASFQARWGSPTSVADFRGQRRTPPWRWYQYMTLLVVRRQRAMAERFSAWRRRRRPLVLSGSTGPEPAFRLADKLKLAQQQVLHERSPAVLVG